MAAAIHLEWNNQRDEKTDSVEQLKLIFCLFPFLSHSRID